MTGVVATACLELFTADVAAKMGLTSPFKPCVVRSDQGSAFVSHHFREFLSARQIQLSLAAVYTPQQNSVVENMWGIVFGTARVLLANARLPPNFHPYALQTAAWIMNRLPRPSFDNRAPFHFLSRQLPSLENLRSFGCLCRFTLHTAWRDGDKHLADRGEFGLYLGPSEESPASLVYQPSTRQLRTVARVTTWEDQFPGIKGDRFEWFPESSEQASQEGLAQGAPTADDIVRAAADNEQDRFMRSCGYDDQQMQAFNRARGDPSGSITPDSTAEAPTPRAAPPPSPLLVDSGATGVAPSPLRPDVRKMPSLEGNDTRVPGHDDPSSRHYVRVHPARNRKPPVYPHSAKLACTAGFIMLAAATSVCQPSCDPIVPAFAFVSNVDCLDSVFTNFQGSPDNRDDDDCLLNAFTAACSSHALAITSTNELGDVSIPRSYSQALASKLKEYWQAAITKELDGLLALKTWDDMLLDDLPSGANLMFCHFVFTVKRLRNGSIEKFKARLVANGNTQKFGVDFDQVFSTVVRASTIRLMLIVAAQRDYNLTTVDIRQAYLQAELNEDLYMRMPQGLPSKDGKNRPLICKLKRSLYGLKQAGRLWGALFSDYLVSWGFTRSTIDTCLFVYKSDGKVLWCAIYVDDGLLADNDSELRDKFVKDLGKRFPTEDKGNLEWLLGVAVDRDRTKRTITLSQKLYVSDILSKYTEYVGEHTRSYDTPLPESAVLSSDDSPKVGSPEHAAMQARRVVYMQLVGSFLWLANMTALDIIYAASQLARFLDNPGELHFSYAIRVLIYLRDHSEHGLHYAPNGARGFETFVDSSWLTSFSCSGGLYMFYGCPFHWFSKTQRSITLSSAEAEYFGAMMAARDNIYLRDVIEDLGLSECKAVPVMFCDSKSAVTLAFDAVAFKNTKHILRAAYFLRDLVAREHITLTHLPGSVMVADLLTKAPARPVFVEMLRLLRAYPASGLVVVSLGPRAKDAAADS